ncbi:hypothetical protein BIY24_10485 [Halobacteriovorax marinus]|uniref:hypothetical protein n=1 Tax=Halobacteriovorax marinus TaxID=97084 RepID=UPI000BC3286E|nr:hypothetical protein [Halobacteriovorax marinus]ATH08359.1 hypothetical protein BIY24_10485 [Halobacteriovorax marinus]
MRIMFLAKRESLKYLLSLFILVLSLGVQGKERNKDLLYCLGQEELSLHSTKRTGPHYFLNQHFINEAASAGEFRLKDKFYREICEIREFPPSIGLLRGILLYEEDIFKQVSHEDQNIAALYKSGYQAFITETPQIFFQFLALIQTQTKYPHCLRENIPKLYEFTRKFQYLREDLDLKELIKDKKSIEGIFTKLKYLNAIYDECDKKQKKLDSKVKTKR